MILYTVLRLGPRRPALPGDSERDRRIVRATVEPNSCADPDASSVRCRRLPRGRANGVCRRHLHGDDDTMLVLINLSGEPISDYGLYLDEGPLSGGGASEILNGVVVNPPKLNADGGFGDYKPLDELAPYSTHIIRLE